MQPLNNDMEELFREAAAKYPLKTEGADWSKVQRGLQAAAKEEDDFRRKGGKRHYAWLLLLLLAPIICNRFAGSNSGSGAMADRTAVPITSSIPVKKDAAREPSALRPNISRDNKVNNEPNNSNTSISYSERSPLSGGTIAEPVTPSVSIHKTQPTGNGTLRSTISYRQRDLAGKNKSTTDDKNSMLSQQNITDNVITDGVGTLYSADNNHPQKNSIADSGAKEGDKKVLVVPAPLQPPVNKAVDSESKQIEKRPAADSAAANAFKSRRKKIYVTVLAGPDFSAVKSSHIRGMKGGVGVEAGYSFTRKFSVEAGMLWDNKRYTSEGKYFNIDKASLPIHTTVLDVNGTCYMIEVPLAIRYNFAAARGHSWTASTGISSYFMKKETYDYWYERYNMKYYAEKEYKNSGSDLFSMLQASAGYQKVLGRSASLRIEPYLKVPLKGIGIGRIPLLSAGMYVGLTIPVH